MPGVTRFFGRLLRGSFLVVYTGFLAEQLQGVETMDAFELVEKIRGGCDVQSSQEALYTLVREALLPRLKNRVPAKVESRLDAEDVLHEAFLRAMGALDLFEGQNERSFLAWLQRIARNLLLDQIKRRSAAAQRFASTKSEDGPRPSRLAGPEKCPESSVERRDWIEHLLSCLADEEAEVIRLHRLESLSFEQIGERWGKTSETARRYYSRAWKKFRDLVEGRETDSI